MHDRPSERGVFKTQMTAAGCSLLVLTLGLVVVYNAIEAMLGIALPEMVKRVVLVVIFLPLGLFLAFQALVFLARPAETQQPPAER